MMRYCLATLFLLSLAAAPALAADATHGDITATLVYDAATMPAAAKIVPNKDVEVCGKKPLFNEELTVGKDGGIRDIVITLFIPVGGKAPPAHPNYAKTAADKIAFDNLDCRFTPHVCLLRTTQTLVLGNLDPIAHNSAIAAQKNTPQNPLLPPNAKLEVKMPMAERLPVKVTCSIHPWMGGLVVVSDNPYMAATDEAGKFTIKDIPAGEHTFRAWHEKSGYVVDVNQGGAAKKWALGKFTVKVEANKTLDLGVIKVAPANFQKGGG